jgi:hypothetical protein
MGVCESCMKDDDEDREVLLNREHIELASRDAKEPPSHKEENKKNFLQTLIDDANGKFISSDYRHVHRTNQTADEIR